MTWMIYGANGYTGQLIAQLAKQHQPVLAGRSAEKVQPLAEKLGLPWRAFALDKPQLDGIQLVLHCAGPFSKTSRPMVDACLAAKAHYLDITGEVAVFEAVLARDAEARKAGVVLLPGTGFDVVPSDCLAALLKRKLPAAKELELAFHVRGRASRGTLKTALESIPKGSAVRRGGKLVRVGQAHVVKTIPFADKPRPAMSIEWGDLATAYKSTGIPDITVYRSAKPAEIRAAKLSSFYAPVLGLGPVQAFLQKRIDARGPGPSDQERATGSAQFWGRASDGTSEVQMTMQIPEGYTFTAEAALECALRVLAGKVAPGAYTPSMAFGPDFAASLPGVRVQA
jgi:short subunit dehydrogenase-like uncharacterized protein